MDDREITDLFFARDEAALSETASKYGALSRRVAMNVLGDREDAEEVESDTLHALWQKIPPERPVHFAGYTARIARNIAVGRFRQKTSASRGGAEELLLSELEDAIPSRDGVEDLAEAAFTSESIEKWLDGLRTEDAAIFVRRYWYGDSVKELAARFGMNASQMAGRLFRLRKNLGKYLERNGILL
ncbi:MAG: sigma-70 family RNA polymerase sigma factor [Clostridia bacterium]|nr:sigma-70 family RNA polymerase sigma factor [Clostridia bacterium]